MATNSWTILFSNTVKEDIDSWLADEQLMDYDVCYDHGDIAVTVYDIDVAFRMRLQFDDLLV